MTDLPIEGELVPIVQGQVVARASNLLATGAGGTRVQDQLETIKTDVSTNAQSIRDNTGGAPDISSLRSKVDALFPLTPDVPTLNAWADIYNPEQSVGEVQPVPGYSSFIDFRTVSSRYESTGITYAAGVDVSDYSGLTDDFHRCFGFRVSGPENATLLSIINGAEVIPFVDITAAGLFRINAFTPARTQDEVITGHNVLVTSAAVGTGIFTVGGPVSTYTIPAYPANTTAQSRSGSVEFDVLVNGNNSGAGGGIAITIPDDLSAQAQQSVTHTFFLGFPSNRSVTATITYEFRVNGSDLVVDIALQSAPTDISLQLSNIDVSQNYTASTVIPRVDNFVSVDTGLGAFNFTGSYEFLMAFHPVPNTTRVDVVPVAVNRTTGETHQFNDIVVSNLAPGFDEIRVREAGQFRSFLPNHFLTHSDLVSLLSNRDIQWVYGLARLNAVSVHSVTEPIDLATGSTLNGVPIGAAGKQVVYSAAALSTINLRQTVTLPEDYATYDLLHVTELVDDTVDEVRQTSIDVFSLANLNIGSGRLIRIQGNSDLVWTLIPRQITVQSGATLFRVVLYRF